MNGSTRISLTVGEDIRVKLSELAAGHSSPGEFLTQLIRGLHTMQQSQDRVFDLQRLLAQLPSLIEKQEQDKAIIRGLRRRLSKSIAAQVELEAVNNFLEASIRRAGDSSSLQNKH